MGQCQPFGVQGLAVKLLNRINATRRRARRDSHPPAIDRIAQQRQANLSQVNPNLMGAAGFQLDPQKSMSAEALPDPVMGDRGPATGGDRHPLPIHRMPANGGIHHPARHRQAVDHRQIFALDSASLQLRDQRGMCP